jgi:hypothetical protein
MVASGVGVLTSYNRDALPGGCLQSDDPSRLGLSKDAQVLAGLVAQSDEAGGNALHLLKHLPIVEMGVTSAHYFFKNIALHSLKHLSGTIRGRWSSALVANSTQTSSTC